MVGQNRKYGSEKDVQKQQSLKLNEMIKRL